MFWPPSIGRPFFVAIICCTLTPQHEVERLMSAARKSSRWGHRDATMILVAY